MSFHRDSSSPATTTEADVLILGGSIAALMAGSYLKSQMPDLDVIALGPSPAEEKRPVVGESLVEPATFFFRGIGLGDVLNRDHAVKNGLSFYYKLDPDNPADRSYSVHSPERMYCLARHLQRPRFDHQLREHALELGVRILNGKAEDMSAGRNGELHRVQANVAHKNVTIKSRWIIDATGRQRWLGRRVSTYTRPTTGQRSVFWFRVADFEPFEKNINATMRRPLPYDRYFTTHHFMGHGNWVWCIPLQSQQYQRLLSVGIVYRPDLFPHPMRNMEHFLECMDNEHPAIADMVRSGTVLDTQSYGNYLYWADRVYSPDGWFLIGDAARAVDPLYSSGLSMTAIQIEQIGKIISCQQNQGISADDIRALERIWMAIATRRQEDITNQYESMHVSFQACMRRYWNITVWFNGVLPLWWNGMLSNLEFARTFGKVFEEGRPAWAAARRLFKNVSNHLGPELTQADFDRAPDFDWLLNLRYDCPPDEVPDHFGRLFFKLATIRWTLAKMTGYRYLLGQLPFIGLELALSRLMPLWMRWALPSVFPRKTTKQSFASEDLDFAHGDGDRAHVADVMAIKRHENRQAAA